MTFKNNCPISDRSIKTFLLAKNVPVENKSNIVFLVNSAGLCRLF